MGYRNKFLKVLFHERISSFLIFLYDFKVPRESWTSHRKANFSAVHVWCIFDSVHHSIIQ